MSAGFYLKLQGERGLNRESEAKIASKRAHSSALLK